MSELSQKKIATITLRFENELIDRLQNEAKNHQVSANTLASQAIRRFLDWDIHQPRIGLVNLNKPVFVKIFGRLKKKDVEAMAKIAKDEILDLALFMKGQIDVSSFISWFEMKMLNSSVQISHMTHNGVHTFVMKHEIGRNWSLYNKIILETIFKELFHKKIDVRYDKSMFVLKYTE